MQIFVERLALCAPCNCLRTAPTTKKIGTISTLCRNCAGSWLEPPILFRPIIVKTDPQKQKSANDSAGTLKSDLLHPKLVCVTDSDTLTVRLDPELLASLRKKSHQIVVGQSTWRGLSWKFGLIDQAPKTQPVAVGIRVSASHIDPESLQQSPLVPRFVKINVSVYARVANITHPLRIASARLGPLPLCSFMGEPVPGIDRLFQLHRGSDPSGPTIVFNLY